MENKRQKKLLGFYDYTVVLTYMGMLSAVTGIFMVFKGWFSDAAACLMIAGVCDMFDGAVASTKDRTPMEKRFGVQIDSLSDLISFGVLPGLFVYGISEQNPAVGVISALFMLCALIRLAYFNVLEEERQRESEGPRTSYLGVPVTTIAVILPAAYLIYNSSLLTNRVVFPVLLSLSAAGFLIPVEIKKPRIIGKIGLLCVGILEIIGLLFFLGVDPL